MKEKRRKPNKEKQILGLIIYKQVKKGGKSKEKNNIKYLRKVFYRLPPSEQLQGSLTSNQLQGKVLHSELFLSKSSAL